MSKAVAYCRLSVADPGGNSIPNQKKRVEEYCINNGLELLKTFVDDGKTGWNFDRPGFIEMEGFCKAHKDIQFLIIPHFDRFSRADPIDAMVKERHFRDKLGVKVLQVSEPIDTDINSPSYQIMRFMQAFAANEERNRIVDRTRSGVIYSLNQGRYCNIPPFGFKRGRDANGKAGIEIDEDKAPTVKLIFREYLKGNSFDAIRKIAQKQGYHIKGNSAVQKTLANPLYAGLIRVPAYKNQPEKIVKGLHQAIVSESTYWQAQEKLNGKNLRSHPTENAFLRGVLKCHCGQRFTAAPSTGKLGRQYWYYFCKKHRKTNLSAIKLHSQFFEMLEVMSLDSEMIQAITDQFKSRLNDELSVKSKKIMQARHQLGKVEQAIESTDEKYLLQPDISPATYRKISVTQKAERARLKEELTQLEQDNSVFYDRLFKVIIPTLHNLPEVFKNLSLARQHSFIQMVFDQNLVYRQGNYRTPSLPDFFLSKALILKEKGLLEVEQSLVEFGETSPSSPQGSSAETFLKSLANLLVA